MYFNIVLFVVPLAAFGITFSTRYLTINNFQLRYSFSLGKGCHSEENIIFTRLGISIGDCVLECALRADCLDLNYDRRTHVCELFSIVETTAQRKGECVRVISSDTEIIEEPEICKECVHGEKCVNINGDFNCAIEDCEYPSAPSNGTILGNMIDTGSRIQYKCDNGLIERDNKTTAVCLDSGLWSANATCVEERNLAEGKYAYQSSTLSEDKNATNAVDGNWGCPCSYTAQYQSEAWWEVDLGKAYFIKRVVVKTRPGQAGSKFRNIEVAIGSTFSAGDDLICTTLETEAPTNTEVVLECSHIIEGRFVRIRKTYEDNNDVLILGEVGVYMW